MLFIQKKTVKKERFSSGTKKGTWTRADYSEPQAQQSLSEVNPVYLVYTGVLNNVFWSPRDDDIFLLLRPGFSAKFIFLILDDIIKYETNCNSSGEV